MPEFEITQEQDSKIRGWLDRGVALGEVKRIYDVNERTAIHLVEGDPVVLGYGMDDHQGEGAWMSTSAKVLERMREAGIEPTPFTVDPMIPLNPKWVQ